MGAAIASCLHLLSLVAGLACLFLRSAFLGDSALQRLYRAISRRADLAIMMPGAAPDEPAVALDERQMRRVLTADTLSLVAGTVWVASGLWRMAGLEKASAWYAHNDLFVLKMALVCLMAALEVAPMLLFIQWRYALGLRAEVRERAAAGDDTPIPQGPLMALFLRRGHDPDLRWLPAVRRIATVEELLLIAALCVAPFMARGIGYDLFGAASAPSADPCRVVQLLEARCGRCHRGAAAQGGFDLDAGRAALVEAASPTYPGQILVRPGDPPRSLLLTKLTGPPPELGLRMPVDAALPDAEIDAVRRWIAAGAGACGG